MYSEAVYETSQSTAASPLVYLPPSISVPRTGVLSAWGFGSVGAAQSYLTYSLSNSAFQFDFTQYLANGFGGICEDPFSCPLQQAGPSATYAVVDLAFRPNENVGYALSGFFDGSFFEMPAGMQLAVTLCDNTGPSGNVICGYNPYLFDTNQASNSTPYESFTLGAHGGDDIDTLTGSLTGTLIANHTYSIHIFASFGDQYAMNSFPSAMGNVTLAFVPEPGTALLVMTGVLGLATNKRRRAN
jgi:hypothetical protein